MLYKYIHLILCLLVIGITICLCLKNIKLEEELRRVKSIEPLTLYDTVYIPKPYELEKGYDSEEKPNQVVIFNKPQDTIPTSEILSIDLSEDLLKIALVKDSLYLDEYYPLRLDTYVYRFNNGNITKQKLPLITKLKPYVEAKYRPFNKFYDLSGGIALKTKNTNYKLGLNLSYYPKISSKVYKDLELVITYNF